MQLESKMPKDPICGMEVDEKKAKFSLVSKGKKYFFCSRNCRDKFSEKGRVPISKNPIENKSIENKNSIKKNIKSVNNIKKLKNKSIEKGSLNEESMKNETQKIKNNKNEIKKIILPIKGMHCASCAANIEKSLKRVPGVKGANVNYASEKASVDYDSKLSDESDLEKCRQKSGL